MLTDLVAPELTHIILDFLFADTQFFHVGIHIKRLLWIPHIVVREVLSSTASITHTSNLIESTVHIIFVLSPGTQLVRKGSELSPVHITEEQWYITLVLFQKIPRHPVEGFLG